MDYFEYGFKPTYEPIKIQSIIDNIGSNAQYDVSITNPNTQGFISIRESGNIEMFADSMLGLRIKKDDGSINMYGTKVNIKGQLQVRTNKTDGKIELLESNDASFLSQNADYVGINSNRRVNVESSEELTLSAKTININAKNININGKPYNEK